MAIQWTNDLATGIPEIDDQHKELFSRVNLLLNACKQGKGKLEIGRTIAFLEDYVNTHFSTDEKNMLRHQYPDYIAHRAQHAIFKNSLQGIKRQLDAEGPGIHIIILTNQMVTEWLISHIRALDRAFGDYVGNRA
jgi:hemerythrin